MATHRRLKQKERLKNKTSGARPGIAGSNRYPYQAKSRIKVNSRKVQRSHLKISLLCLFESDRTNTIPSRTVIVIGRLKPVIVQSVIRYFVYGTYTSLSLEIRPGHVRYSLVIILVYYNIQLGPTSTIVSLEAYRSHLTAYAFTRERRDTSHPQLVAIGFTTV